MSLCMCWLALVKLCMHKQVKCEFGTLNVCHAYVFVMNGLLFLHVLERQLMCVNCCLLFFASVKVFNKALLTYLLTYLLFCVTLQSSIYCT